MLSLVSNSHQWVHNDVISVTLCIKSKNGFCIYRKRGIKKYGGIHSSFSSINSKASTGYVEYFCKQISVRTCYLLECIKPACNFSARNTQVTERVFKLNPLHAKEFSDFLNFLSSLKVLLHYGKTPFCTFLHLKSYCCNQKKVKTKTL